MPKEPSKSRQLRKIGLNPTSRVKETLNQGKETHWLQQGHELRARQIYIDALNSRPIEHLKKLGKTNPLMLVLGPALGYDTLLFYNHMLELGIAPEIDVFGLTKTIRPEVQEIVKNDYSSNIALETLGSNPKLYSELIKALIAKYDLIMAPVSVGHHTSNHAHNLFFTALMLAKGGEAYIDLLIEPSFFRTKEKYPKIFYKLSHFKQPEYYLEFIEKLFKLLIKQYNEKNKTNLEFEFEYIPTGEETLAYGSIRKYVYVRIKRTN